jgi:hypothetical protein
MLSVDGDYTFGQGSANFWINSPDGVAQSVQTRLLLWEGEWFLDNTVGTPYAQQILGYNTKSLYDMAIKSRILGTPGVTSIESYNSVFDPATRSLTISCTINTQYSVTPIPVPPVVI